MLRPLELGPLQSEYASLVEDLMRVATIHAAIHAMLVIENGEAPFDRRAMTLLLYSLLGIAIYHLIVRRVIGVRRGEVDRSSGQSP